MNNTNYTIMNVQQKMSTQAKRRRDKILKEYAEEKGVSPDNVVISLADIYSRKGRRP